MTTDPYGDSGPATFGPGGQSPVAPGYGIGEPTTAAYGDDTGATAAGSGSTKETAKAEAGQVKETAAGAAQQVAGTAKEQASNVVGEAKAQATNLLDQVRGEAGSQVGTQKDRLAGLAHSYAKELGSMASGTQESGPVTDLVQDLSRRLGGAGHWIENHEPADVLEEVRRFARRRPGAFLLTALAAGVVVGRLTRGAVDEHRAESGSTGTATPELATGTTYVSQPAYTAGQPGYVDAPATGYQGQTGPTGFPAGGSYGDQPPATQPGYGDQGYVEGGGLTDPYGSQGSTYGTNPGDVR